MLQRFICYLINSFCCILYKKEYTNFLNLQDIKTVQTEKMLGIINSNRECEYGQRYDFKNIKSIEDFQEKVPLTDYEDYKNYINKIRKGHKGILTEEGILLFQPSSGSTSASKLIPYTKTLREEFQRGIRPWLYDLYTSSQAIKWGKSYWSVTPAASGKAYSKSAVPIGFEDDKEYFGTLEKILFDFIMAVPSDVVKSDNVEEFYYKTALELLICKDLTLISVWNPCFLMLLLEYMERHSEKLITAITFINKKRGKEVSKLLSEKAISKLWLNLKVLSCWCDANAKNYADKLKKIFPELTIQPKGLLATEGFISFPLSKAKGAVLSLRSHFFEFEAITNSKIYLADELEKGKHYSVIITTSGGLYRYRLKDIIQVTGFMGCIPVIKFIGKQDNVSDLFGEKLNELFVKTVLNSLGVNKGFIMLAPESDRYVLYQDSERVPEGIDNALRENFHYDYCRKLGQLKELKIFHLKGNPKQEYLEESVRRGQRLGDIKPVVLHLQGGWDKVFKGEYL